MQSDVHLGTLCSATFKGFICKANSVSVERTAVLFEDFDWMRAHVASEPIYKQLVCQIFVSWCCSEVADVGIMSGF